MQRFLILRLDGPMQAWGTHTYEDYRPSNLFPTRSALVGLLGACLGIDRRDQKSLDDLAQSVEFTVRTDRTALRPERDQKVKKSFLKVTDYQTVLKARRANRPPKEGETIETRREYLFDAVFTVAIGAKKGAAISLEIIAAQLKKPWYTPFLGRRSCPIARPLFFDEWQDAENGKEALDKTPITGGVIYAEDERLMNEQRLLLRDVPQHGRVRKFGTRMVYIYADRKEDADVSQPS